MVICLMYISFIIKAVQLFSVLLEAEKEAKSRGHDVHDIIGLGNLDIFPQKLRVI